MIKKILVLTFLTTYFTIFSINSVPPEETHLEDVTKQISPEESTSEVPTKISPEITSLILTFKNKLNDAIQIASPKEIQDTKDFIKELKKQIKKREKQISENENVKTNVYYEKEDIGLLPFPRRISIAAMGADLVILANLVDNIRSILEITIQNGLEEGKMALIDFIKNDNLGWTTKKSILAKKPKIKENDLSKYDNDKVKQIYKIQYIENIQDWMDFKGVLINLVNDLKLNPIILKKFKNHFKDLYFEIANTTEDDIDT